MFPEKLFSILSREDLSDAISWMPNGRSWRILSSKKFEEKVLGTFFPGIKYASFKRQVNVWGFTRITEGHDQNSYFHEMFLRGRPDLVKNIKRLTRNVKENNSTRERRRNKTNGSSGIKVKDASVPKVIFPNYSTLSGSSIEPVVSLHHSTTSPVRRVSVHKRESDGNFAGLFEDEDVSQDSNSIITNSTNLSLSKVESTFAAPSKSFMNNKICSEKQSQLISCSDSIISILRQGKSNVEKYIKLRDEINNQKSSDILSTVLEQNNLLYSMLIMGQNKLQERILL